MMFSDSFINLMHLDVLGSAGNFGLQLILESFFFPQPIFFCQGLLILLLLLLILINSAVLWPLHTLIFAAESSVHDFELHKVKELQYLGIVTTAFLPISISRGAFSRS